MSADKPELKHYLAQLDDYLRELAEETSTPPHLIPGGSASEYWRSLERYYPKKDHHETWSRVIAAWVKAERQEPFTSEK